MIINPRREAINDCDICDHNGMVMILPATGRAWETRARCPHNAVELLELKRNAEADHAAIATVHRLDEPRSFSEPIHRHDDEPMF